MALSSTPEHDVNKHSDEQKIKASNKISSDTKSKSYLTKRERRALRLKSKKHSEIVQKILPMWEVFRRDDATKEKRLELVDMLLKTCQGKISDLCFAHDTARVIEDVIRLGTDLHRWSIFAELKNSFRLMSKSHYARFVILKLIKYGAKEHRLQIIKRFRGHVARLVNHRSAVEVIDTLYNDYANATQRGSLLQELYGNPHALQLVQNQVHSLSGALSLNPDKQQTILGNVNVLLTDLASKGLCKYTIVQHFLLEYFQVVSQATFAKPPIVSSSKDIIPADDSVFSLCETLVEHNQVVPMLHTREGVRAALHLLWLSPPRLRESLIRGLKTCISSIARNEHGHLFLIGLLDCVDDIMVLERVVIKEILEDLKLFCIHPECRKVLLYALSPRDVRHFSPQLQTSIFVAADDNPYTTKSLGVRVLELRSPKLRILPQLLELASTNLMDIFVGDATPDGRLAFHDRGRLVLLAEILIRSAAHHLDPSNIMTAYNRNGSRPIVTAPISQESSCGPSTIEVDKLQQLRREVLLQVVRRLLVPAFTPTGHLLTHLGKRSHGRDAERIKRHKLAVRVIEQTIGASGKPAFSSFERNSDDDVDEPCELASVSSDSALHTPFLERPEGMLFMRRLLQDGRLNKDYTFARLIMEHVPPSNLSAWMRCNRSCFVLVSLYELGDESICQFLRTVLAPYLAELGISALPGAVVLYKHLKSNC